MHFVDAQTHGFDYRLDFNDWYQYLGPKTKLYADELSRANSGSGLPQINDLWRESALLSDLLVFEAARSLYAGRALRQHVPL
jgi:hypothetical protein